MEKRFMTFAEAIEFLRLSRPTINRLIARKAIPNYKVGRLRLFDPEELVEWVKSHRNDKPKKVAVRKSEKKEGKK
jgi:excisionase family DNA binding protein